MPEQQKPGAAAPAGAGQRGPAPEQERRPVEAASAAPGEQRAASRPAGRAAESGHPDVHKALGDQYTAEQNLAAAKREGVEDKDAQQSYDDARARLRELGYE